MTIILNPAPADKKCERCGKHISELEPFDNPIYGGSVLVKTYRAMIEEENEEYEDILGCISELAEHKGWDNAIFLTEQKYGKQKVDDAAIYDQLRSTVEANWECKDCIKL